MTAPKLYLRIAALALLTGALAIPAATAQSSASYRLEEASLNSGGHPEAGVVLSSASFRVTQDSVAESFAHVRLNGPTLVMEGGFVSLNPPPLEVTNLVFSDETTLAWDPQPAVQYGVYRGTLTSLPGTFGACFAYAVPGESTNDGTVPLSGGGYFYLVTARNGLLEESPKGYGSNGTEEGNPAPCP